jgi:D-alanyl-D-alanine carboxypeptidase
MFWGASMSILKWVPRPSSYAATRLHVLILAALAALLLFTAGAGARRRHYRVRYAPPASAMAIDLHTGRILYSRNASEPRYPASLTKVMTLYLLFDALRDGKIGMTVKLRVSAHAAAQSPTKLDLSEGDTISVADAIGAIVTKSANDMAVAVAEALAGSEEEFARRMTQKARTVGMLHTTFRNASGLPDPDQKTTAQDLVVLGQSILADHPERCKVFATKYFQYDGEVYRNHNTLLFSYEGMEGMKTGFTSASGFNLIATARRADKRLLAVVLGGSSAGARNAAMRNVLDNAWPKAMTQIAARKAGLLTTASVKPKPAAEPADPKPQMPAAAATKQAAASAPAPISAAPPLLHFAVPVSRLKRKPDRTSISILYASIEATLAAKPTLARANAEPTFSDMTTDEPEDKAERAAVQSASYVPPAPQEITRNETLAALAGPKNLSVHYKTVRQPEVLPLAAASLDAASEPVPAKAVRVVRDPERRQEPVQTLAAATAEESEHLNLPGPFHVQVGAFADRGQAQERLESVKQVLGTAAVRTHPEFIMPVSLPTGVTMFRARLSRFADEAQAKAACKRLKKSGIECWDIRAQ